MTRAYNFSAGPATLPLSVLEQAKEEFLEWNNEQASIVELSHRKSSVIEVVKSLKEKLRCLLKIPVDFEILFMHGGAQAQFFATPMNLLGLNNQANYIVTGHWSALASQQAMKYGNIHCIDAVNASPLLAINHSSLINCKKQVAYTYYCSNETLTGLQFHQAPAIEGSLLVADMTSDILTRPIDFDSHGLIFASAQKNLGIAGLGIVIVKQSLLNQATSYIPDLYSYRIQAEKNSLLNTIPVFACYISNLICEWIIEQGGIEAMQSKSKRLSDFLYDIIDEDNFYQCTTAPPFRSKTNISLTLKDNHLISLFLSGAHKEGLLGLKGHRKIGGIRASIYNAMAEEGVYALGEYMQSFRIKHQSSIQSSKSNETNIKLGES